MKKPLVILYHGHTYIDDDDHITIHNDGGQVVASVSYGKVRCLEETANV